ncbi:MAG: hypothetical protein SAL07_04615 [Oscillatoria sp. PMC 1051.18]|uniref:hypothetical protein n=1 Tax=Oscillatoria salina TaxID=331517 RepID=UPI0013B7138A|nr:hypothetical protein [Oscillatoria salina]MBZ8180161.1 hypothetical protein [Oscillatoria salina IIICB1]MEC4892651.1 hypothetical protein [Oscillatoria sp. PMC 1050.18]MEC5029175.1 hypothetical protein [Oscillatoria sp. PMC 1051.18]NET88602.1 hypothetical protein [Kamptonema sp. SIO1D9]
MLTHHRRPVCLSWLSTDLPICSTIETAATLYQKDRERFHLLLKDPQFSPSVAQPTKTDKLGLLWLELSPYRVIMTMQGNANLGYRHFWEPGVYGISRYWLHGTDTKENGSFRLRNYTRSLRLEGRPLPESMRLEYELWSEKVRVGHYVLYLEIHH